MIEGCNCYSWKLPYSDEITTKFSMCGKQNKTKLCSENLPFNNNMCDCKHPCNSVEYSLTTHQSYWPDEVYHLNFYNNLISKTDDTIKDKFEVRQWEQTI